ncbi:hypothetical protein [Phenylobacterium sp.]|uniref:hypothetical protein n=1 Tax=Phenylobacterium sp. TaxID=1871053 RepID=UPI002DE2AD03|nr:hypothetical protein [Phenylobacterium sp.]
MDSPHEYRARAVAARLAAEKALTPELRASLIRVEATWLALAATAELVIRDSAAQQAEARADGDERERTALLAGPPATDARRRR